MKSHRLFDVSKIKGRVKKTLVIEKNQKVDKNLFSLLIRDIYTKHKSIVILLIKKLKSTCEYKNKKINRYKIKVSYIIEV